MSTGEPNPPAPSEPAGQTAHGDGGSPEGHTPEKPGPDEHGQPGAPAGDASVSAHHAADADEHHGSRHDGPALGPVDWGAWAVSLVGVGAGLMIAVMLFISIQHG
jgi:hypothetical protein